MKRLNFPRIGMVTDAGDTQPNLPASSGNPPISGKTFGTTTCWSGLIDDVRI